MMVLCSVAKYENTIFVFNVKSVMMKVWSEYLSPFCNADFNANDNGVIF